jgi:hypothetical protein
MTAIFRLAARNIHELLEPFLPQNPHEYCVDAFEIATDPRVHPTIHP